MNRKERKCFLRGMVLGLSRPKLSNEDISNELGIPRSTICCWLSQYNLEGRVSFNKSPGRRKKSCARSDRLLCRLALNHNLSSARELLQMWRERVSIHTVYGRLKKAGIRRRRRARCPYLTPANKASRLQWSMARAHWRAVWNKIIFSDESRYRRTGNDGRILVWRREGERFNDRNIGYHLQAGGGSVHVWGAIWKGGRSELIILRAAVNHVSYINTLRQFFQSADLPQNYIFQHDNAPAHSAEAVRNFFQASGIRCLPWPSRSPHLNPIEHVWDHISKKINAREVVAANVAQLEQWVIEEWRNTPQQFINNLIDSLPRLRAVIQAHGGQTRY